MGKVSAADYQHAAGIIGCSVYAVQAVATVESNGDGMLPDGRPKILFERHVMYQRYKATVGQAQADIAVLKWPTVVNPKPGGYSSGSGEHDRLELAAAINRNCALESCSWGAFQIMGYHWKTLGYPSLQDFVNSMYLGESAQLDAFIRFIMADQSLVSALRDKNWAKFARRYNGPAYSTNRYDEKMAAAYNRLAAA
ncbi:N-acetylmuramidase family protein [Klebsiella pneumoniae]|uniref:N-acetylmuramidase family protein n=1 Tax=Klebsiella pneumoniae TaxID=573 RepID=UPI00217D5F67|nr:N-acetylmuramidase family protein [Klebsiella pneumoniae]MCS6411454.1 N-acetylmuramidase family protein [Klebsiella pneumoniae]